MPFNAYIAHIHRVRSVAPGGGTFALCVLIWDLQIYDTHLFDRRGRQKVSISWGEQVSGGKPHRSKCHTSPCEFQGTTDSSDEHTKKYTLLLPHFSL